MSDILLPASPLTSFTYEEKDGRTVRFNVTQPFKENLLNVDEIMPAVLAEMLLLVIITAASARWISYAKN